MSVFEYGSGGSTLFISNRVSKLVSVEHDKGWYEQVSIMLSKERIYNCEYILREPKKSVELIISTQGRNNLISTKTQYAGMTFENYVKSIDEYPDSNFDLILIDGRARLSCIYHVMSKLSPESYLMFDDSHIAEYAKVMILLSNYQRIDFFGAKPYVDCLSQTSIWEMKPKHNSPQL